MTDIAEPEFWLIGWHLEQFEALDESLQEICVDYQRMWSDYLNGHWSLDPPTEPGLYPVLAKDGLGVQYKDLVDRDGYLVEKGNQFEPFRWAGWYWSGAVPQLMPLSWDVMQ
jgi:hypothetical protein